MIKNENVQFSQIKRKCGDILLTGALDAKHIINLFLAYLILIILFLCNFLIIRPWFPDCFGIIGT